MELPLQITFRNMDPSEAVAVRVRKLAERLERFHERIVGCRVVIEAPHRRHHHGKLFHVRVDLTVKGAELLVRREPAEHHAHEDVYVALRDAFRATRRQLEDHARLQRGETKAHAGSGRRRAA